MGRMVEDTAVIRVIRTALRADTDCMADVLCKGIETVVFKYVPTIDVVPVVRCKDCKWCSMGECEHKLGLIVANDENYCSYGERKGGDHHD